LSRGFKLCAATEGNAALLATGVACAVIAVILDGKAYGSLTRASRSVSRKSIMICVIPGILDGLWAPFVNSRDDPGNTLGPYSIGGFSLLARGAASAFSGMSIS